LGVETFRSDSVNKVGLIVDVRSPSVLEIVVSVRGHEQHKLSTVCVTFTESTQP
jgi:hypothetical protein